MPRSYYDLLGIPEDANEKEILRAYRREILKVHPDLNQESGKAVDRTKDLNAAKDILLDPAKRQRYDEKLRRAKAKSSSSPTSNNQNRPNAPRQHGQSNGFGFQEKTDSNSDASQAQHQHSWKNESSHSKEDRPTGSSGYRNGRRKATQSTSSTRNSFWDRVFPKSRSIMLGIAGVGVLGVSLWVALAMTSRVHEDLEQQELASVGSDFVGEPVSPSVEEGEGAPITERGSGSEGDKRKSASSVESVVDASKPLTDDGSDSALPSNISTSLTSRSTAKGLSGKTPIKVEKDDEFASSLAEMPFGLLDARRYQDYWAERLNTPVEYVDPEGIHFILVPPGTYNYQRSSKENKSRLITVDSPFYLGKYEITQEQFEKILGFNPSAYQDGGPSGVPEGFQAKIAAALVNGFDTSTFPVEFVSWLEAREFCAALTRRRNGKHFYRLPTDVEWQYACRAGCNADYYWGEDSRLLNEYTWNGNNSGNSIIDLAAERQRLDFDVWKYGLRMHAVGEKKPNSFGLCDILGNVGEWTSDTESVEFRDKQQLENWGKSESKRTIRGLAFGDENASRIEAFTEFFPDERSHSVGFRVLLELPLGGSDTPNEPKSKHPPLVRLPVEEKDIKKLQAEWAEHLNLETVKTVGDMKFVLIPPGDFLMGWTPWSGRDLPLGPQRRVKLQKPYYFSIQEVTQQQFMAAMKFNPSLGTTGPTIPVNNLTFKQARDFCTAVTNSGITEFECRLPTEAEWEFVLRGGKYSRFWFSDNEDELENYAWIASNSGTRFDSDKVWHDVGGGDKFRRIAAEKKCRPRNVLGKPPNPWGVYDMEGNVGEWCLAGGGSPEFLQAGSPPQRVGSRNVYRGGNFLLHPSACFASHRLLHPPEFKADFVGFRVVLEIPDELIGE